MNANRTIDQIKKLRERGSRKWGKDLYLHILPMIEDFKTVEEIRNTLLDEYELVITNHQLNDLVYYYRRKLSSLIPDQVQASVPIAQKEENPQLPSLPPPTNSFKRNYEVEKDYRTPVPKPSSIFEIGKVADR